MMNMLIDLPLGAIILICVISSLTPPLLFEWVIYRTRLSVYFQGGIGVEPAIIGSVGLLFGLFAAFLANDIWNRNQTAQQAVVQEGDAIRTLARYAEGMDPKLTKIMHEALLDYTHTVIEKDWPAMTEGKRSKELLSRVRNISNLIISGEIGRATTPSIQGRMIDAYTAMRDNRQTRVQQAETRTLTIKWYALLIFGFLTQAAIAIVHINRPRPQLFAQAIFGVAFAACLSILIINEFPFSKLNPISYEPLQKAAESLSRH
ncbi:MAG: DUF4239 domain-containing protein [Rhodocyclales bacterium]|nr:DUF4239 domain-containing protein [Rhodocyclales bacterium]